MSAKKASEITPERIQKIIAQAGIASRREAETLIAEGLVTVNGKTAKLGEKAQLGVDAIKVKGKLIQNAETKAYYLFFKPKNVIAMVNEDEEGRPTIKDFIKGIPERVFTVGRMDYTGEGAILLTNDGEMAQKLSKSNDLIRRYHVKVDRHPTADDLSRLARGGRIEKVSMNPHHIRVVQQYTRNALIEISFQGAGVTEIRKYFENKGFFPEKVTRVGIGHLKAEKMNPGEYKKVDATSIQALLIQPELAEKLINNIVKAKSDNFKVINGEEQIDRTSKSFTRSEKAPRTARPARGKEKEMDMGERASRRPPRNRPLPAERAAGIKRAPRDGMPAPRFKRTDGERPMRSEGRPAFGDRKPSFARSERPAFGDRKPSFGRGAPRGGSDRPAFGDRKPSFGDRKPSFGRGAPRGGERSSFGDRARGDRPAFARSERPSFGDRKPSFGDRAPRANAGAGGAKPFGRNGDRNVGRGFGDGGMRARPTGGRPAPRGGSSFKPRFK